MEVYTLAKFIILAISLNVEEKKKKKKESWENVIKYEKYTYKFWILQQLTSSIFVTIS